MGKSWDRRMRRQARKRVRNRLLLAASRPLLSLIGRLGPERASRLGEAVGRLAFSFVPGPRRRVLRHLSLAFDEPEISHRLRRIALGAFRNFTANALEWTAWLRLGPKLARSGIEEIDGLEHLETAKTKGRGILAFTAHFGLFELLPVWVFSRVRPAVAIGRRASDSALDAFVVESRLRMGVPTIPQTNAREILRILKDGGLAGVLPDQDIDKLQGLFVPFFGRPAWTPSGPATVSAVTGAPILPLFIFRRGPARHRIVILPPIADPGGRKEERIRALTAEINRVLEHVVAARPDHWAWFHERWATTPESLERRRERRARLSERRRRRRR